VPEGTAAVALHDAAAALAARRGDAAAVDAATALSRAEAHEAGSGQSTARGAAALAELALWQGDAARAWAIVEEALALVRESEYVWYSSKLWDLVTKESQTLYVPDRFIKTGTDGRSPKIRRCGSQDEAKSGLITDPFD
jgi:hypothetical protein